MSDDRNAELEELLARPPEPTRRPTVPALEEQLHRLHPLLDHGFVRVVDYMGDDAAIVQAARVSYGKGTKTASSDRGLIRYLMRHRHTTPFEMCELKLHVKLPIFVARQWIRHRTANVNEYSARYSILDREFYLPTPDQLAAQSTSNRQGREQVLSPAEGAKVLDLLRRDALQSYQTYAWLLNDQGDGSPEDPERSMLARELARMNLTVNYYTQWYWKIDLHNLLHFLSLRADAHAQYEIRVYADKIAELVAAWVPVAHEAFRDYRVGGGFFSRQEIEVLRRAVDADRVHQALAQSGLSKRERRELLSKLGVEG
ncbi:MAG: FAD-dependent thymidylate synthase [Deltaproteobacteria bacterium]|nr:MAG: FAD-dependent thymidylate synthase [Deltaproteobacteria bacterium]